MSSHRHDDELENAYRAITVMLTSFTCYRVSSSWSIIYSFICFYLNEVLLCIVLSGPWEARECLQTYAICTDLDHLAHAKNITGPLLSNYTLYSAQFCKQRVSALIRLPGCKAGPSLSIYARRHVFALCSPCN